MAQNITQQKFSMRQLARPGKQRVKDSVLLVIVFLIGLIGTCYILHFALSNDGRSGYFLDDGSDGSAKTEIIYFTAND